MKLRNKKTGEIIEGLISAYGISGDVAVSVRDSDVESGYTDLGRYKTLAELNEEWEDYKPAEPLIKDEKIRKAVRAWAEATGTTRVNVWAGTIESRQNDARIYFDLNMLIDDGDDYTIAELCGEEEE